MPQRPRDEASRVLATFAVVSMALGTWNLDSEDSWAMGPFSKVVPTSEG